MTGLTRRALATMILPLLLAASPAGAQQPFPEVAEAWRFIDTYRPAQGREVLDRFLREHPEDRRALYYRALADFYEGKYPEAVGRLEELGEDLPLRLEPELPRIIGDTARAVTSLTAHSSEHFVLYLDEGRDWILARPALETLERCYRVLGDYFGVRPEEPVRVEIFGSSEVFLKVSSLAEHDVETSGAIGICKYNKIMMLSPRALALGYRWMDTLAHEYIHYLVVRVTGNRAPIWVHEGVAGYLEASWKTGRPNPVGRAAGALLAQALEEGSLVPFDRMDPSLVKLDTPREVSLAFAECSTAVDFIVALKGEEGLHAFLRRIGERERGGTREALRETVGLDFAAFEAGWRKHVAGMGLRRVENLRVDAHRLAREGSEEELLAEIGSRAALNHLRLGDTLRKGGRPRPALTEYQRACREDPDSPYLLNKVAITALLLEDLPLAAEYAARALEIAPDYPLTFLTRGDLGLARGLPREALLGYDEYNEINPFNPRVWRMKGRAHLEAGERDAARAAWVTGLRLSPGDGEMRRDLEALERDRG